jgi:hypothetical protein
MGRQLNNGMETKTAIQLLIIAFSVLAIVRPAAAILPPLPPGDPLAQDISQAPLDSESATVIQWLNNAGGWGLGRMQIDFSIEINDAVANTPTLPLTESAGYYLPDCDTGIAVPIPSGGAIEGVQGYQCDVNAGDCHLIVYQRTSQTLYELYQADITNGVLKSTCLATWEVSKQYGPNRRGLNCTSADAAGLPMAPLLFDDDEVANGSISHALRFILPNNRIRAGQFVLPATHVGAPSGPAQAPPYGARLRLRSDFPLTSLPNEAARTVARAMQHYGIVLADGGNVALTARSDRFTQAKWTGLLGSRDLQVLKVSDFEMIAAGARYAATYDCQREQPPVSVASTVSVPLPGWFGFVLSLGLAGIASFIRKLT